MTDDRDVLAILKAAAAENADLDCPTCKGTGWFVDPDFAWECDTGELSRQCECTAKLRTVKITRED